MIERTRPILAPMRGRRGGWIVRGALFALAFTLALAAFRLGVGVDARAGVDGASLLTHVYYALGLFVLGGLDLGVPVGASAEARGMLWAAYFLAPALTTSAVVEGVLRVLRPAWLERRGLRGHVVIAGAGRLGILFLELLREREPRARVLLVDKDAQRANVSIAQERFGARFLAGDVRTPATLDSVGAERARAVVLLTDDDLVNLEAAWRIAERSSARVVAHVGDIGMRRTVARVEDVTTERLQVFNSHAMAAERLYTDHLATHFAETAAEDVVVLAGFGRFGQTILEYLQRHAAGEVQRAIVVDAAAERQVRLFRAQVAGFEDCELVTIEGDLDEPGTWQRVEVAVAEAGVRPVYVVATDDDQLNLRTAIALRSLHADARILVRTVYESAFSARIADELAFTVLPIDRLLRRALGEHQSRWLA